MRSQALTAVLELLSLGAVRAVCRKKGGAKLYAQGVACNFLNNAVLGPPTYELVANRSMSLPFTPLRIVSMPSASSGASSMKSPFTSRFFVFFTAAAARAA